MDRRRYSPKSLFSQSFLVETIQAINDVINVRTETLEPSECLWENGDPSIGRLQNARNILQAELGDMLVREALKKDSDAR